MDAIGPSVPHRLHPDAVIAELAGRQHGVLSRRQLLERGISRAAIRHRLATGHLESVRPGVYRVGGAPATPRGRWMGDVLACGPDAVLAGESAAQLWGARRVTRCRTTVITPHRGRRPIAGIDLRTTRRLTEWTVIDGIPVTTLERTIADCARSLGDEALEATVERAVVALGLRLGDLPTTSRRLNRLVRDLQIGTALTDSELEDRMRAILKKAGLPLPRANAWLWTGDRHYRPDFLWADQRLVVEIDGWAVHRGQTEADRRREAALSSRGFTVQRFTFLQLVRRPDEVRRALVPFLSSA